MAEKQKNQGFEEIGDQNQIGFDDFHSDNQEELEAFADLRRALRRKKGFGLFFVECGNPTQMEGVIRRIKEFFPQKNILRYELSRESETLYEELLESYQKDKIDIACITGFEQVLYGYEDTKRLAGWSSGEIYHHSWKGVPPLLSRLNRQRESFQANLPIALVFLVRSFVIDYFVQRAPDFFDWRSGLFKLSENSKDVLKASQELVDKDYAEYKSLTSEQRMEKILELKEKICRIDSSDCEKLSDLLREQGRLFRSNGDYLQALDCYERSLIVNPDNHKSWGDRGRALSDLERYEEAITSYSCSIDIDPDYHYAWDNRGDALLNLERYKDAITNYDRALEIDPEYHYTWDNRGDALRNLERYKEAIASYDRAIKINSDYHHAWNGRGNALRDLGRYEEAITSYDRAIEINPDYHYAWDNRGDALSSLERYEEAITSYDRAIEINPDYHHAWHSRGYTLGSLERYEEAITSYDRAIEINPDYHYAWDNKGYALSNLGRYKEAIANYDRAIEINPEYHYAWNSRGYSLSNLERYEEAIASHDRAIEINPEYHYAWNGRGNALRDLERYEEAIASFDRAIEINSEYYYAWRGRGITLYLLGRFQEASECFYQVFTIQPTHDEAWNNHGYLLLAEYCYGLEPIFDKPLLIRQTEDCEGENKKTRLDLNNCQKSLESFTTSLSIDPNFLLAYANCSVPAYYLEQYQIGLDSCNRAIELNPDNQKPMNEVIYSNRGCIYLQLKDFTHALQDFNAAISIDPKLDEAWIGQGTALFNLGDFEGSELSFMEALRLKHPLAQDNLNIAKQKINSQRSTTESTTHS